MRYEITEEIAHIKGYPRKLVIFLHGYIDSDTSVNRRISEFIDGLDNVAIHIPQAPFQCEIHERKRQWYSMHRYDPNDDRKLVPTIEECADFYNRMGDGINEAFTYLNKYIDDCLNEYQLEDKDLYLCGFSQGAMLAMYTSLMRENPLGGCVSFSGIICPHDYLTQYAKSTPNILLIHGLEDNQVRYQAMKFTKQYLEKIGCLVETQTLQTGKHEITEEGIKYALRFINQLSSARNIELIEKAAE